MNKTDDLHALTSVRDRFVGALDCDDNDLAIRLARQLTDCGTPLPDSTCRELGLSSGSSYGNAAREVILRKGPTCPAPPIPEGTLVYGAQAIVDRFAEDAFTAEGGRVDFVGERHHGSL